jgi:hypothetical protein
VRRSGGGAKGKLLPEDTPPPTQSAKLTGIQLGKGIADNDKGPQQGPPSPDDGMQRNAAMGVLDGNKVATAKATRTQPHMGVKSKQKGASIAMATIGEEVKFHNEKDEQNLSHTHYHYVLSTIGHLKQTSPSPLPIFYANVPGEEATLKVTTLLDTGATDTYITKDVADTLKLIPHARTQLNRNTLTGFERITCDVVNCTLMSLSETFHVNVQAYVVSKIVTLQAINQSFSEVNSNPRAFGYSYPTKADVKVDILLGMDSGGVVFKDGYFVHNGRRWLNTHFGHVMVGRSQFRFEPNTIKSKNTLHKHRHAVATIGIETEDSGMLKVPNHESLRKQKDLKLQETAATAMAGVGEGEVKHEITNSQLNAMIQKFWNLEDVGIQVIPTQDETKYTAAEQAAVTMLEEKTVYDGKRYTLPLLWKSEDRPLNNYGQAMARLKSEEKRLLKNPELLEKYNQEIANLIESGSCKQIDRKSKDDLHCYFLPHRPVVKPGAKSSKVRPVFDASAGDKTGRSINSMLHNGPKLQRDLPGILLRMRHGGAVVVAADIKKMFHQFKIAPEDTKYQRFIWRNGNQSREPDIYEHQCVTFGFSEAPFKTIATIDRHVDKSIMEYPDTVDAIKDDIFVDDVLQAKEDVDSAYEFIEEAKTILEKGSLHLYKFVSNSKELLARLNPEERGSNEVLMLSEHSSNDDDESTSTLGLQYNPKEDTFEFKGYQVLNDGAPPTKRRITSKMARLWDPLGFLGPFIIRAKLAVRNCWLSKVEWDDDPSEEIKASWYKWLQELDELNNLQIPRRIGFNRDDIRDEKIHIMTDASQEAMCAAAYLRTISHSGEIQVRLIMAKTRVAPVKSQTIPRLELVGCVMGARLAQYIAKELKLNPNTATYWTDSKTALQWIQNEACNWKCFVAARVSTIQELSNPKNWRHIPGIRNPSDMGSRGFPAKDICEGTFWLQGPDFLRTDEETWPDSLIENKLTPDAEENRSTLTFAMTTTTTKSLLNELMERISDFWKLIHIIIYCRRAITPKAGTPKTRFKPWNERLQAIIWCCQQVQQEAFEKEINLIKKKLDLASNFNQSRLISLDPILVNGVLRVGGRLAHASNMSEEEKHPIILPSKGEFVDRLIVAIHAMHMHAPKAWTQAFLLDHFHILRAKSAVNRAIRRCGNCKRHEAIPFRQKMADLPQERTNEGKVYDVVGLDLGGPFKYKTEEGKIKKSWIVVYTCLTTRAVILDFIQDMTTETIIQSLRRLFARRGAPMKFVSDCACNFVKANKELINLWEDVNWEDIKNSKYIKGIEWDFISPHAPHQGGIWESMVKMLKHSLKRTLGQLILHQMEFITVIMEIEAQINSRPLSAVVEEAGDLRPVTPAQLVLGYNPKPYPQQARFHPSQSTDPRVRWKLRQEVSVHFWNAWKKSYLKSLQVRGKWHTPTPNIKPGQVVIVFTDKQPRMKWPLAIITEVITGRDGRVRKAKIQMQKRKEPLERAIQHLYPLEYDECQDKPEDPGDPDELQQGQV